ncbi:MAG: proteasome-activating nucleotidase, partial [Methanogenium sp.]|nr:proteasome-activating nucleotidase [Methanogenium sp.]
NGADLKAICTEAGMFAIRSERDIVTHNDFLKAIDKVAVNINQHPRFTLSDGAMFA